MNHLKSFTMKTPFVKSLQVGLLGLLAFWMLPAALRADQSIGLPNAGLELWQDGRPLYWTGSTGNIPPENLSPSAEAHTGQWACRLVRTQKQHVRWSSSPLSLQAGAYRLEYFVKGQGCLRNTYYSGMSYASYSPYDTVMTTAWQRVIYTFELKRDLDSLQLIFSLCQTDTGGLYIDDVSLFRELPDSFAPCMGEDCQIRILPGGLKISLDVPRLVQLYDLSGHCLISRQVSDAAFFDLPAGFYLLRLPAVGRSLKLLIP